MNPSENATGTTHSPTVSHAGNLAKVFAWEGLIEYPDDNTHTTSMTTAVFGAVPTLFACFLTLFFFRAAVSVVSSAPGYVFARAWRWMGLGRDLRAESREFLDLWARAPFNVRDDLMRSHENDIAMVLKGLAMGDLSQDTLPEWRRWSADLIPEIRRRII
jgi:hypothetical protein